MAEDSVFNWNVQRRGGNMVNVELDIKDTKMNAEQAESNSDDGSGEYEEAFEDIGKCPACNPKLQYSILVGTNDYGMNKTDKEHKVAIASTEAYLQNIAAGAMGAILAGVEVEDSTESEEVNIDETNQSSQNDWAEVHQVRNEEQKVDEWLIDSGASIHVMNQKVDLWDPKETMHAVMIRSGKAMAAQAIGNKPTKLCDTNGNTIELADMLNILEFKKKIISLLKLLDQGYKVEEWTTEYFWLSKSNQQMQVKHKEGYAMYYFQAGSPTSGAYMVERMMDINKAHDKMSHMGEDIIQKTMARYWQDGTMQCMLTCKGQGKGHEKDN